MELREARRARERRRRDGRGYVTVRIPRGLDWLVWRLISSDRVKVTLRELKTVWTFRDMMDAHAMLDALEDADEEARAKAEQQRPAPR